jgi:glycosyltransferase involved in cell wall biosynthesis
MGQDNPQNSLIVVGVHLKSEGYPNTLFCLQDIENSGLFDVTEINVPMWNAVPQNQHSLARLLRSIFHAAFAHFVVILRYLAVKRPERAYIPYPAVFVLFLFSWLPVWLRPKHTVADVFISLYDTIVLDRQLIKKNGLLANILKWVEKRAYLYADRLVVDTPQNARFLSNLFNLPESKLISVPLSIDEHHFKHEPYQPDASNCRVLFVGTLVPLHGITTILEAIHLLSKRQDIQFKLIGDGQDAGLVEAWLKTHPALFDWERVWQSSDEVAKEIAQADICLGVFGGGDKTQRVCPLKIYAYASMGRAIISGETRWLKETSNQLGYEAIASVPVNDAAALASKIAFLADEAALREKLAHNSRKFYQEQLGNQRALQKITAVLLEANATRATA